MSRFKRKGLGGVPICLRVGGGGADQWVGGDSTDKADSRVGTGVNRERAHSVT